MAWERSPLARRPRALGGAWCAPGRGIAIEDDGELVSVTTREGDDEVTYTARTLAANCAPGVLAKLRGLETAMISDRDGGAQVKVNMLLSRLPRLRDDSVDPADAFSGTFHVNESYRQLESAHRAAASGRLPTPCPPRSTATASATQHSVRGPSSRRGSHTDVVRPAHAALALRLQRNSPDPRFRTQPRCDDALAAVHVPSIRCWPSPSRTA